MNIVAKGIIGVGLFGTRRGLSAKGGGALRGLDAAPQVLEFRGRGGDTSALPQEGEEVVFRRVVRVSGGDFDDEELDIIGVLSAVRDVNRRAGFQGACAAVRHGNLDAYADALEEARRLLDKSLEGSLDDSLISSWSLGLGDGGDGLVGDGDCLPGADEGDNGATEYYERSQSPGLELQGELAQAVRLHLEIGIESPDERIEEGLRQVSWLDSNHGATVLIFYAPRRESRPIDWSLIRECRELKQVEIERIEDDYEHAYQLHLRDLEREYAQGVQLTDAAEHGCELEDSDCHGECELDSEDGEVCQGSCNGGQARAGGEVDESFLAEVEAELQRLCRRVRDARSTGGSA
ncbi:hypothetical protein LRD18_02955 [Halorhodospira halochloris]|uniref:hypothetical protein n=1 Tax=Halorhodospira halochloris TaxID=1052 RepID=UPI001EE982C8|nr:hypothetical protein [Halorhodospira halochloris]MCG5529834.1 hypothetical protein [Halorhodospira halochloris]